MNNISINVEDNIVKNAVKLYRKLTDRWDFQKNNELGINISKVNKSSHVIAWWVCTECNSPYDRPIYKEYKSKKCPYCAGRKINDTNSLASIRPDLASQWHPTLNGDLTPNEFTLGNDTIIWWICEKQHKWKASINSRTKNNGYGCPYCSGRSAWVGETDMWTTNPELASLLLNPEDGYKYMQNSNVKIDWKCNRCENIIKGKKASEINNKGLSCNICGDGMSYPEKIIFSLLKSTGLDFKYDEITKWSKGKRYDFYIPSLSIIIEAHGIQHYKQSARGRTLAEEQANDMYKEKMAKQNGIEHYIVIDCRESDFNFIVTNILNSRLKEILKIDIEHLKSIEIPEKTLVIKAWELWNSGEYNIKQIEEELKIARTTVRRYLKNGYLIGKCTYKAEDRYKKVSRKVVKLNTKGNIVSIYDSIRQAQRENNYSNHSGISKSCNQGDTLYKGFKWMYLEEYQEEQEQIIG